MLNMLWEQTAIRFNRANMSHKVNWVTIYIRDQWEDCYVSLRTWGAYFQGY